MTLSDAIKQVSESRDKNIEGNRGWWVGGRKLKQDTENDSHSVGDVVVIGDIKYLITTHHIWLNSKNEMCNRYELSL